MLEKFVKEHKAFVVFVVVVCIFFVCMNVDHMLEMARQKKNYEQNIKELKEMIPARNLSGDDQDSDTTFEEQISKWLTYYYGVSSEITESFRENQLMDYMTEEAFLSYEKEYESDYGYEEEISEVNIYYNPLSDSERKICLFYDQIIKWPQIDPISSHWYLTGNAVYDSVAERWKISEIDSCEELVTREEYNEEFIDTNGNSTEGEKP